MTFSAPWRKLLLVLHVVTSVGFLGAAAAFMALALAGATAADGKLAQSVYIAMRVITWGAIVPLAVATLVIGLVQSIGTPWGMFRYYWVIIKLVLTIVALAVLMMQTETVDLLAQAAESGTLTSYGAARFSMILHSIGGIAVLLTATVLSVYKPRGVTSYGARAIAAQR
jgi:hypothetical protein